MTGGTFSSPAKVANAVSSLVFSMLSMALGDDPKPPGQNEELIVPELVDECARSMNQRYVRGALTRVDRMIPYDTLVKELKFLPDDLDILLNRLRELGLASNVEVTKERKSLSKSRWQVVYFAGEGECLSTTKSDACLAMLKITLRDLDRKLVDRENLLKRLSAEVKLAIKEKQKRKAMYALKSKKRQEKQIENIRAQRVNLEIVFESLQKVNDDKEVLQVLRKGSVEIKRVIEVHGLSVDHVAEILDEVRDQVEEVDELSNVLAGDTELSEDEAIDLNAELESLVAEETKTMDGLNQNTKENKHAVTESSPIKTAVDSAPSFEDPQHTMKPVLQRHSEKEEKTAVLN
eukprot:CAMPEP_0114531588 /NCGR_PEP_ID=MMETSP0109-20121206/26146_1 /TAXON_ID=29199 /ORGANISM="Chlorarachnion reptans, Strain CCCM449" /LENGTH=347 /DNA_ID=CAMNT_0001714463 /DNA_START=334 /DNA_END=1377 /DNA_ORIENTATION=+